MDHLPLELDPERLALLGTVSFYFCGIFLALSLVAAILLQGAHEVFRKWFNKVTVDFWLRTRALPIRPFTLLKEMPAIGSSLFSLPYWQLTGQIGAAAGAQLNLKADSILVRALANVSSVEPLSEVYSRSDYPDTSENPALLRELTGRVQAGINSLHAYLRNFWNAFDYVGAFTIVLLIACLLTTLKETQGQRYLLYAICFFAWVATPILRRIIERLVPFR